MTGVVPWNIGTTPGPGSSQQFSPSGRNCSVAVSTSIRHTGAVVTTEAMRPEPEVQHRTRRRRSELTRTHAGAILVIAVLGVVAAVVSSDAAPTGSAVLDALYRAVFVTLTVLSAARARRWSLLIAAALVAIGSSGWLLVPAGAALLTSLVLAWTDRRHRVWGAAVGALVGVAALQLTWPASPSRATALLAALAILPLWISGYRVSRRSTRRRLRILIGVLALLGLIGAAVGAVFAATQRGTLEATAAATTEAAQRISAGSGGDDASVDAFTENTQRFDAVADLADSWWMLPARAVPVVAQNVAVLRHAARAGADLNTVAATLAEDVDYEQLQQPDGSVDLERLRSFQSPLSHAATTARQVERQLDQLRSPWLVSPVRSRLTEFQEELQGVRSSTELATTAAESLPAMLGADGPRRYLLLLGNPAEARDLGGHIGNWAELVAEDGHLRVERVGSPYELFGPGTDPAPQLSPEIDLPPSMAEMQPQVFPQNWGATPDLATAAGVAADLYTSVSGGAPIDGVIYADPRALAGLLSLTGPITIENGTEITAEQAVQFLTVDQFANGADDDGTVSDLVRTALDRLTTSRLPSPARLGATFGPIVDRGELQFVSTTSSDDPLLRALGLTTLVAPAPGGDLVAVINRNANPSKIDAYLRRRIDYDVRWDPDTGDVRSRVTVTLENTAPATGLPSVVLQSPPGVPSGTNRTQLAVLSPLDADGAIVDGTTVGMASQPETDELRRYSVVVDVPPGGSRTVTFDLHGSVRPGSTYRLRWINQPLVHEDEARLVMHSSGDPFLGGDHEGSVTIPSSRVVDLDISTER